MRLPFSVRILRITEREATFFYPHGIGSGMALPLSSLQNLFGGWIRSRDIVGEVQNGAQTTPVVGAERERGHAPGELPGE